MENIENQAPAVVVEDVVETPAELPAEQLFENLTSPADEEPEQAEQQTEEPEAATDEPEVSAEEAQKRAITDGLQELYEDGWDQDELLAFSKDKTVREQIAAGKSFMRVVAAYERRQRSSKPATKKSPPALRTATTSGARNVSMISEMTDAQFDEFSKRAKAALLEGKRVSFK